MTRTELLELASLDAFGLLDKYERDLYTRSFHHAPVAVQDEILELQARIVADPALLPGDLPPADLRLKVLQRVAAAVEAEASELAPLATIGRSRALATGGDPGDSPSRHRAVVSRQFWRAATFVLFAALVVVGYQWSESTRYANTISVLALTDLNGAQIEQMLGGTQFQDLIFEEALQITLLHPEDLTKAYRAAVLTVEDSTTRQLVFRGLPGGTGYALIVRDAGGTAHTVKEFESLQRPGGVEVVMASNIVVGPGSTWEIWRDGERLLASA